jgi:glycosyltransferase involved in cell wall biosynthesis
MKPVYIVLSTTGVGGAEKRFSDIWYALLRKGMDVHLVMDGRVHTELATRNEYARKVEHHPNLHVLDFGGRAYRDYVRSAFNFFRTQPRQAIVHYPLAYVPGARRQFGHRTVVSWVNSTLPSFRRAELKNAAIAWFSFVAADRIDVLNPINLRQLASFPALARKATLTAGGTHVDGQLYRPQEKALDFVFLGRFEPEKQGLRLLRMLPEVHRRMREQQFSGYRFLFFGEGSEAEAMREELRQPCFAGIPVSIGYSREPEVVLGRGAVFFSLQRETNYPSKALAEAMAAGSFPIMTNTGESALMVEGCPHHALVPRDFTADDVALALQRFLQLPSPDRARIASELATHARKRFDVANQASYFADLYAELDFQ